MDVRCERCKTEYELDDARITEAGVTVKCASCGHVFKVKNKALGVAVPVKSDELAEALAGAGEVSPAAPQREWKVRQAGGNVFAFKELTTLQRWIVERKVCRDDEISLSGESWKRLGSVAELASFFRVLEEASRAPLPPKPSFRPPSPPKPEAPAPSLAPDTSAAEEAWLAQEPRATTVQGQGPTAMGEGVHRQPAIEPAFAQQSAAALVDDEELIAAALNKRGGSGKWVAVALGLVLLGGGLAYYFLSFAPAQQQAEESARIEAERAVQLKAEADAAEAEAAAQAKQLAEQKAAELAAAAAALAVVDAGPADAGLLAKPEPVRDFDFYLAQGDRLREGERAKAALEAYAKAIELKPARAEPIAGRGLALLDLGQPQQAEVAFERALKLNAHNGEALMGLAEALKEQNKKEQAIAAYQKYLEALPNGPEANVARVVIERLKQ